MTSGSSLYKGNENQTHKGFWLVIFVMIQDINVSIVVSINGHIIRDCRKPKWPHKCSNVKLMGTHVEDVHSRQVRLSKEYRFEISRKYLYTIHIWKLCWSKVKYIYISLYINSRAWLVPDFHHVWFVPTQKYKVVCILRL